MGYLTHEPNTSYNPRAEEESYAKSAVKNADKDGPHKFIEVAEQSRTYFYPAGQITLEGVKSINVSKSGTHRINLTNGKKRIMPPGWLSIEFDADRWTF